MLDTQRSRRTLVGSPLLLIAVVVFSTAIGILTAARDEVRAQEGSAGDAVYAANCAGCHQAGGEGLPGTFPPLTGNPAAADPDYVATVVSEGMSGPIEVLGVPYDAVMPAFGNLTDEEVAAVTEHVVGLATGVTGGITPDTDLGAEEAPATTVPAAPPSGGDPDRGHDLFAGSDRFVSGGTACASCHSAGDVGMAGGRGLGPDLTHVYGHLGGEAGMTAWLTNLGSPTMTPIFADRPLSADEIADLVAFLAVAPDRERPSDAVDWVPIAGLFGAAVLLAVMVIPWLGRRRPYAQQLAAKAATTTRSPR